MKLRNILATSAVVLLAAACGDDEGEIFTISQGSYTLSDVKGVSPDDCNLAETFPDGTKYTVNVDGDSAVHVLGSADATRNPVTTINGNTLEEGSKTYDVQDSSTCTETVTVKLSGNILADDQFEGTLTYQTAAKAGSTGCTAAALGYKAFPCSSTMTYTAKKAE